MLPLPIYMDNHATTRLDPRVLDAMLPFFTGEYGNPASQHRFGTAAATAVDRAREEVADAIGASPSEIVFTSGATESLNLAIKGLIDPRRSNHIVTVQTEHKAVLDTCRHLERLGLARVTYIRPRTDGRIDLEVLAAAIEPETVLVSVMAANNEIGVLQPVQEVGALCRDRQVLFLTDAAQAVGKIPVDVGSMGVDLLAVSAHKVYGPKGVGALFVDRRTVGRLRPLLHGGGQERGLRSGTLPVPLLVGLGRALSISVEGMSAEAARLTRLRDRLWEALHRHCPSARLNGHPTYRLPGNLNVCFPGLDAEALACRLQDVAVSVGSACSSATLEPSHVLRAIGLSDEDAEASIRFGIGRFNTDAEVDYVASRLHQELVPAALAADRQPTLTPTYPAHACGAQEPHV